MHNHVLSTIESTLIKPKYWVKSVALRKGTLHFFEDFIDYYHNNIPFFRLLARIREFGLSKEDFAKECQLAKRVFVGDRKQFDKYLTSLKATYYDTKNSS